MNAALTGMLKAKNISSKVEFVRGQRKEFFVINEQASREELPVENFSRFEDESVDFPVMQLSHLH